MSKLRMVAWIVFFYVAAAAQIGLRPALTIHGIAPDCLWAVATLAIFGLSGPAAIAIGSLAALLADCLSFRPLGCGVLAVAVVSPVFLSHPSPDRGWLGRLLAQSVFVLTSMVGRDALACAARGDGWNLQWTFNSLGQAAYTLVIVFALSLALAVTGPLRQPRNAVGSTPQLLTNRWNMLTPE